MLVSSTYITVTNMTENVIAHLRNGVSTTGAVVTPGTLPRAVR